MNFRTNLLTVIALGAGSLAFGTAGCELIASVDRTLIPTADGGVTGGGGSGGAPGTGGAGTGATGGGGATTGGGGTGGATGGGGSGGCTVASDCTPPTNDCEQATCENHVCGTSHQPSEHACATNGGSVCDGMGNCVACVAPADCPATASDCIANTCTANVCGTTDKMQGTTCGTGGMLVCDGMGNCSGCTLPSQCTGAGPCQTNACSGGNCVKNPDAIGTPCTDGSGDTVCDANGNCVQCTATDLAACPTPADCLVATCSAQGVCGTDDTGTDGDSCTTAGGNVCVGGACVECIPADIATDCPAPAQCQVATCTANVCGVDSSGTTTNGSPCTMGGGSVCLDGSCVDQCTDGVQDGDETGIDCGGATCLLCSLSPCTLDSQCKSMSCNMGTDLCN